MDAESGELFISGDGGMAPDSWQLDAPFSCSDLVFGGSEKPLQEWAVDPDCTLNDSESEDVLHGVDPNEVFLSGPPADPSSESDSGISEDPVVESPVTMVMAETTQPAPATVYQLVYDISSLGGVKTERGQENVISIELDDWSSQVLFSDSCIVNELPVLPAARLDGSLTAMDPPSPDDDLLNPNLQLTEEEQKLLSQEGVSLPNNLPLTKAEERILKRVRRKIRNKQSAQDSRRRRKEYIDGLESRAAACSAQNKELQRTVEQLEKRNMSLLAQLRQLQSLIKRTVSKGAQTSTCLLIILVSLGLIIMPSFSPFNRNSSADDDYRPTGVISRNILTDPSSSQPTAEDADSPAVQSDSPSPPSELGQSGPPEGAAILQEPIENFENTGFDGTAQEGSQSGNSSGPVAGQTEALALGLKSTAGKGGSHDPAKPAHADEM
ncbi:cyclic AMP-responsive element-binding protein 3-like protein 4 [Micropterus salmoides]|uniref:cyclic AMP-responsive element-binding protein 3-like protein 4 n=1 Tax=Micropterus salmoides TaxID=27706 RepID=UPI0018EBB660|nr:cyclic AMP-responsive element-binding protein 3-like protein 4 [Micropterus salmoides]XP_038566284.1 cyclic AMP-responsive element-binding protein 3-like protein 4 [Micropterus salmoides]XP_038566285.1 cyclic AMP-responsive element-binding protein 3-like protein 4 [Micropterus salmoides]